MAEYFEASIKDVPTRRVYAKMGWANGNFIIPGIKDPRDILPDVRGIGYKVTQEPQEELKKGIEAIHALLNVEKNTAFLPVLLSVLAGPAAKQLNLQRFKYAPIHTWANRQLQNHFGGLCRFTLWK